MSKPANKLLHLDALVSARFLKKHSKTAPIPSASEQGVMTNLGGSMHSKHEVQNVLEKHGFELSDASNMSDSYKLDLGNNWQISAFTPYVGNIFKNNLDKDSYEYIHVSLFDCIGTEYDFKSASSLDKNIERVVATLREQSDNDDILKCEKCDNLYVSPKKPSAGKKWKPFLSCKGMIIVGSGKNKGVRCDGTSKKIPAVVVI